MRIAIPACEVRRKNRTDENDHRYTCSHPDLNAAGPTRILAHAIRNAYTVRHAVANACSKPHAR